MPQNTCAPSPLSAHHTTEHRVRDAASVVFNLTGYTVTEAVDLPLGGRRVVVTTHDLSHDGSGRDFHSTEG